MRFSSGVGDYLWKSLESSDWHLFVYVLSAGFYPLLRKVGAPRTRDRTSVETFRRVRHKQARIAVKPTSTWSCATELLEVQTMRKPAMRAAARAMVRVRSIVYATAGVLHQISRRPSVGTTVTMFHTLRPRHVLAVALTLRAVLRFKDITVSGILTIARGPVISMIQTPVTGIPGPVGAGTKCATSAWQMVALYVGKVFARRRL